MKNRNDFQKGVLTSTFFHIILIAFSLWFNIPMREEKREYVDLTWTNLPTRAVIQSSPKGSSSPSPIRKEARPIEPTTPVDLPKLRSMKELESLPLSQKEKLQSEEGALSSSKSFSEMEEKESLNIKEEEKKVMKGSDEEKEKTSYILEGSPAERLILSKVVPKYPPGLQKEVMVRIQLVVDPDGTVTSLIPLQKGDPILDEISLKALSQWKFAPLPSDRPQLPQEGQITFIFRLE